MKTTNKIQYQALEEIMPIIPVLIGALEVGTHSARTFFAEKGRRINSSLAPALVRYEAKEYMKGARPLVDGLSIEEIANNGLEFHHGDYVIRVWKSNDGTLPPPGPSEPKRQFLKQQLPPRQLSLFDTDEPCNPLALAILWSVDADYNLTAVRIVCPRGDVTGEGPIEEAWSHDVVLPVAQLLDVAVAGHLSSEDLPFEIIEHEDEKRVGE